MIQRWHTSIPLMSYCPELVIRPYLARKEIGNVRVSWVATYSITMFTFIDGKKKEYWPRQLAGSATTVFTD